MDVLTNTISQFVSTLGFQDLPAQSLQWIKGGFLDTISTTLSGSQLESTLIAKQVAHLNSISPIQNLMGCTLIGQDLRAEPMTAALINGTAAHAELFDDNSAPMIAHPSSPIVSALLPLAEIYSLSGKELITAYAAGFEVSVALGRASNPQMYEKGWHVTRSLGILGATAACCKLLKLSEIQIQSAMGIAASMASGVRQNFGTMTMALHVGLTARDAIHCALLAKHGFLSAPDALSGQFGYFNCFRGMNIDSVELGTEFELLRSGIIFKPYPSGAPTHAAIECALTIRKSLGTHSQDIESVICHVHPWNAMTLKDGEVHDTLRARVSLKFCLAVAIRFGKVSSTHFTMQTINDLEIKALMAKILIQIDGQLPDNGLFPARLRVNLISGASVEHQIDIPPGSPQRGWSIDEAREKLENCAKGILQPDQTEEIINTISDLENTKNIRELCHLLESRPINPS